MKKVNYIKYGLTALTMAFSIDSVSTEENEFSGCGGYDKAW